MLQDFIMTYNPCSQRVLFTKNLRTNATMDLSPLSETVKAGNRNEATKLTQEGLDAGVDVEVILDAMIVAMDNVGQRFQKNEIFVPEMLI
jgi:methanogenic corrinoid protein MtbC1